MTFINKIVSRFTKCFNQSMRCFERVKKFAGRVYHGPSSTRESKIQWIYERRNQIDLNNVLALKIAMREAGLYARTTTLSDIKLDKLIDEAKKRP
jgi:hypothetical protein